MQGINESRAVGLSAACLGGMRGNTLIAKIVRGCGYVWLVLAGAVVLAGIIGVWVFQGFRAMTALMSPFNVINYLAILVTLVAPGLLALMWADKLDRRAIGSTRQQTN